MTQTKAPAYVHSEAQLETLFRMRVRQVLGGMVVKMMPTVAGVPDRLVLLPTPPRAMARIELVELKTVTGKRSPIQVEWHKRAASIGIHVTTLHGLAEIDAWVRDRASQYDRLLELL